MIIKYNRWHGVPKNHWVLMKIDCFGEMGGPAYSTSILYYATSEHELVDLCKEKDWRLDGSWHEYFIKFRGEDDVC